MKIVSIDGNIGAGKTTMLNKYYQAYKQHCIIITEPIDKWRDLLQKAVQNPKKHVFELQRVILQHFKHVQKEINAYIKNNKHKNKIVIVERSAMSSICIFAQIYLEKQILTQQQYQQLKAVYKQINIMYDLRILIDTKPHICLQRIKKRNRECERSLTIQYLQSIDENQRRMYNKMECTSIIIDGNKQISDVFSNLVKSI